MIELLRRGISEEFIPNDWTQRVPDVDDDCLIFSGSNFSTESYKNRMADSYKIAKNWAKNIVIDKKEYFNLFIHGGSGSGKTHLGCLLIKSLYLKYNFNVLRKPYTKLVEDYFKNDFTLPDYCKSNIILFIEDVGRESINKDERQITLLEYIINYRKERKFFTIIATNLTLDLFRSKYKDIVCSLISRCYLSIDLPAVDLGAMIMNKKRKIFIGGKNE